MSVKKHILILGVCLVFFGAMYIFEVSCFIRSFLSIPCPGCGMTRAMLSLFTGDIKGYLYHNAFALVMVFLILFAFHRNVIKLSDTTKDIILIIGGLSCFLYYIIRLFWFEIP